MSNHQPAVSVVIPSYQHQPFVRRAVESALEQSFGDLEVVVVDDGSTDGTADEVERIADTRVRLVRQPQNRSEHARNKAIRLARGRYIALLNSDDEWLPDKLARQMALLEGKPDVAACFTAVEVIDESGRPYEHPWLERVLFKGNTLRSSDDWLRVFFIHNELCISSAVVRRSVLDQVGLFKENFVQLSDMDMWVRIASVGLLEVLPERLTRGRVLGPRNLSAPSPAAANRTLWEHSELLGNFIRPPLSGRLDSLFPEAGIERGDAEPVRQARFALFCMTRGGAHRIFADRVLTELFSHGDTADVLRKVFGPGLIKAYWQNRSEMTVVVEHPPKPSRFAQLIDSLKLRRKNNG